MISVFLSDDPEIVEDQKRAAYAARCSEGVAIWNAEMDQYDDLCTRPAATLTMAVPVLRFALAQKMVRRWW